ncbi:MAG: zinc-ribbon domain containing protein [Verrucomicrobiales bacterium]|nr:zinc-ribbon domain containing protein [Verrucomicrobiales bacterium]
MKPDPHSKTQKARRRAERRRILLKDRDRRVHRLIEGGWIRSGDEIPESAIPFDPDRVQAGWRWNRKPYYEDVEFTCRDCGKEACMYAEDQAFYFETAEGYPDQNPVRCEACRRVERQRKENARVAAGHQIRQSDQKRG